MINGLKHDIGHLLSLVEKLEAGEDVNYLGIKRRIDNIINTFPKDDIDSEFILCEEYFNKLIDRIESIELKPLWEECEKKLDIPPKVSVSREMEDEFRLCIKTIEKKMGSLNLSMETITENNKRIHGLCSRFFRMAMSRIVYNEKRVAQIFNMPNRLRMEELRKQRIKNDEWEIRTGTKNRLIY